MQPYADVRILGPYTRPDGRQIVITVDTSGRRSSISYPKYLLETSLGRRLEFHEVVHHIDGNPENNTLSNLEVLTRADHGKQHHSKYIATVVSNCLECDSLVELNSTRQRTLAQNKNRGKVGPFCSSSCSGKYGKRVQLSES